jgi:hypothetical protein
MLAVINCSGDNRFGLADRGEQNSSQKRESLKLSFPLRMDLFRVLSQLWNGARSLYIYIYIYIYILGNRKAIPVTGRGDP